MKLENETKLLFGDLTKLVQELLDQDFIEQKIKIDYPEYDLESEVLIPPKSGNNKQLYILVLRTWKK